MVELLCALGTSEDQSVAQEFALGQKRPPAPRTPGQCPPKHYPSKPSENQQLELQGRHTTQRKLPRALFLILPPAISLLFPRPTMEMITATTQDLCSGSTQK
jgi:hypothetical protein